MAGRVSHSDYYRAVAATAGVSYKKADPAFLARVRAALEKGDEYLNSIPLREWDIRAVSLLPNVSKAFREHGDLDSLAGRVCLLKRVAADAAVLPRTEGD